MASPPKCRVCGKAEWSHLCSPREERMRPAEAEPAPPAAKPKPVKPELGAPRKRGRPKGNTDRKAYQRDLMRKRRAALKAKAQS